MPTTVELAASLEVRGIELAFGTNKVLRGVDLDVPAGRTACVIGPSGSGKSTLLRTVNRLLEPDAGDVRLGGESVLTGNPDVLRRRIGMVFQHFNLFPHKTVLDNITLPLRKIKKLDKEQAAGRGRRPARARRAVGEGRGASRQPLRRTAAAGRDRSSAGDEARGDAVRRGHIGARIRSWSRACSV